MGYGVRVRGWYKCGNGIYSVLNIEIQAVDFGLGL